MIQKPQAFKLLMNTNKIINSRMFLLSDTKSVFKEGGKASETLFIKRIDGWGHLDQTHTHTQNTPIGK